MNFCDFMLERTGNSPVGNIYSIKRRVKNPA